MSTYYGDTLQDPSDAAREARIEAEIEAATPVNAPDYLIPALRKAYPHDSAIEALCLWVERHIGIVPRPMTAVEAFNTLATRQPITAEQAQAWFDPGVPLPAAQDNLHTTTP